MMPQTVLPFKLEMTNDTLTAQAGLALFGEFCQAQQLADLLDAELPAPGSGAGYRPSQFIVPLVLLLHGGGRTLEDLRELRRDAGLRELLQLAEMPSADATGNWLRRMGVVARPGGSRQALFRAQPRPPFPQSVPAPHGIDTPTYLPCRVKATGI